MDPAGKTVARFAAAGVNPTLLMRMAAAGLVIGDFFASSAARIGAEVPIIPKRAKALASVDVRKKETVTMGG